MKKLSWILSFVLLIRLTSAGATTETEAPYIYYYSRVLNGIVIERADGTDSRMIGQGLADSTFQFVEGAGWSPDGNWFVWQMVGYVGKSPHPVTSPPYAVSVDGQKTLPFLEEFDCPYDMHWSPDGRYLLIRGTLLADQEITCPPSYFGPLATYWLIDMEAASIVNSISTDSGLDVASPLWEMEKQQLRFAELRRFSPDNPYVLVTMHFNGAVEIEPISEEASRQFGEAARATNYQDGQIDNPLNKLRYPYPENIASPDGRYVPDERSWGSWIDTQTGQTFRFPANSSAVVPVSVGSYWHSDSNWVFLGYERCFAGCDPVVGRVSVFNPISGQAREIADCRSHPTCVNWLPEQVDIDELPPGDDTSVLPEPESIDYSTGYQAEYEEIANMLADVATHVLICSETLPRSMTLVQNKTTGETDFILPVGEACNFIQEGDTYVPETHEIVFALSPDRRFYAITDQLGNTEYTSLFDAQTGERIATLNFYGIILEFSEDSSKLITWGRYAIATWDIATLPVASTPDQP